MTDIKNNYDALKTYLKNSFSNEHKKIFNE